MNLCLASYAGYGACVRSAGHEGTHRDAFGYEFVSGVRGGENDETLRRILILSRLREERWDDAIRALRNATAYLDSDMSKGYALGTLSLQSFDILVTDIETLADEVQALI